MSHIMWHDRFILLLTEEKNVIFYGWCPVLSHPGMNSEEEFLVCVTSLQGPVSVNIHTALAVSLFFILL